MSNVLTPAIKRDAIHVRWMIRSDMREVLVIEESSFAEPWNEDDFVRRMRERNCIGMVAEVGGRVVGYMIYYLKKSSLDVTNIAVHPEFRRKGIGTAMLDKLKRKLSMQRRQRLTLQVADYNLRAQVFFRACGMLATGINPQAYSDGSDAYQFEFLLAKA